ncbi:MAG TPA: Flp pilus assembly protein CpaB [Stellaceae bacterium]|nr:Flp pilus assembly protein CpaB [Stellaceae bacterium]
MKGRSILLLVISALLGVFAIGLVRGLSHPVPVIVGMDTKKVVVAAADLRFGDKLAPASLREVDFPPASVPAGAFGSIAELTAGEPRVVLESIRTGEPILATKVSGSGGKASLSTVIDPDMRAVTIRVDDVSGAAGFITPSDRVDVMLTHGDNQQGMVTDVLLQNIKVLAVDQEANEHKDKPTVVKAVTLEVSPDQAQKISLARTVGTLSLALRNLANADPVPSRPISIGDLTGEFKRQDQPQGRKIEVIRGAAATAYEVSR